MTTENLSSASNSQSTFSIGFTVPTDTSEIQVYVEDATTGVMTLQTAGTDYNIVGTDVVFTSGNEPPAGTDNVQILRNTDVTSASKQRTFVAGSSIRAADLNANFTRLFDHAEDKIQTSDIANKAVTTAKIALGAVTTNRIAGSAVTTNKINASAVTAAKIGTDAVTSTKIQDSAVTSDKLASQAVTNNKIASDAVTTGKIADGAITSAKITNQSIISNKINPLAVTTGKLNDQAVTTAKIADNAVTPAKLSETYLTQSEIINLVDDVGGFVPIADEKSFPATNPDLNNGFGTLISIQEISNTNHTLITSGMGGGTSMTTIQIENGAGTGNTVSIQAPTSSFSFPAGYGAIVETTNTLHLYNLHRIVPKSADVSTVAGSVSNVNTVAGSISNVNSVASNATNVNTVAGDISNVNTAATNIANINTAASNISNVNNFTEKYQIAASDPTTDGGGNALAEGDLYFNSTANQLKIYNGSTWQNGITAPSNTAYITGNTFTGDNAYSDNIKAKFGSGNDLEIFHDGSNSRIHSANHSLIVRTGNQFGVFNGDGTETILKGTINGSVDLYYDGTKKAETSADGFDIPADSTKLKIGASGDLTLFHDGSNSYIKNNTGDLILSDTNHTYVRGYTSDKSVGLFFNNSRKAQTSNDGLDLPDNSKLQLGDSQDLQIYHDGNNSIIDDQGTGGLQFKRAGNTILSLTAAGINVADPDGPCLVRITGFEGNNAGIELIADEGDDNGDKYKLSSEAGSNNFVIQNNISGSYADKWTLTSSGDVNQTGNLSLIDDKLAKFGTDNDLQISHNGNNSFIKHVAGATGQLYIDAAGDKNIILRAGNGLSGSQTSVNIVSEGQVALYFDGTKKFETTSNGWKSGDNIQGVFGTGDDLSIYHDGSNSYLKNTTGTFFIKASSGRDGIEIRNNGKVALFNQGVEKFRTTATGTTTLGQSTATGAGIVGFKVPDNPTISNETTTHGLFMAGNGDDLIIGHNGTDSFITNDTGNLTIGAKSDETGIKVVRDAAVELYYNGTKMLETTSMGAKIEKAGNAQLHLINTNTTGINHCVLGLRSFTDDGDTKVSFGTSTSANRGELKYVSDQDKFQWRVGNGNRFTMTSTEFSPIGNNNRALGNSSNKWSTLHSVALNTGDIHMNNLDSSSGNEVDGTKGSWSLQEGADDLFLINRVSGKKYKFNITEIS